MSRLTSLSLHFLICKIVMLLPMRTEYLDESLREKELLYHIFLSGGKGVSQLNSLLEV